MHPNSVGNYQILRTIADKGSYQVYLAKHKKLGRNTLLKVYSGADVNLIERFEREAKIVADLDDDSIVSIYDFGKSGNRYFISMEYVEGCNLREYLTKQQLKDEEIISFSYQIAKSVSIFHDKGYIHRDLKPENILIDLHGRIKITDFGITLHGTLNRLTQEGDLFGTPLYMSPEQVNNLPLSPSSDVFALGIIFYEMATGINPFAADHYAEIFSKILTVEPPSSMTNRPSLPQWYSDLVGKMLRKNSDTRIQNAIDIVNLFDQKITISQRDEQKVNQDHGVQKPKFLLRTPFILIVSLLLIVIVIFIFKYYDSQKSDLKTSSDPLFLTDSLLSDLDTTEMLKSMDQNNTFVDNKSSTGVEENNKVIENAVSKKDITEEVSDYVLENTTVFIKTWPWCRVYLNYQLLDVTPMTSPLEVIPGNYLLSLQNPDYPAWSDSITIKPNVDNEFNINLDSLFFRLKLKVIPWGEVFIDGKYMGTTPFTNPISLSRKPHILEVRNKYFETWEDSLIWDGQAIIEKFIVLRDNKRD